jgi:putative oxygen-independent coproporphyrinogen III oxidase
MATRTPGLGLYIHIPFCAHRCDYCAFTTFTDRDDLIEAYVDACCTDLQRIYAGLDRAPDTIFVGGGTPSRLAPETLARLLRAARATEVTEVSLECNPESTTPALLDAAAAAGANRISLGVQSLQDHVLVGLGRPQRRSDVEAAITSVRAAGFSRLNVDLVYGGAGESDADWRATLEGVLELAAPLTHVSAYALTVEPGTPLAHDPVRHPDDDSQADRYAIADELLSAAGLSWYEISNWATPGEECRHNLDCWAQGDYLAVGAAAHGHRSGVRTANVATPELYIARIAAGASPIARTIELSDGERDLERLELAVRTHGGVPASALNESDPALDGLVTRDGDRLVLTRRGRLLANEVSIRLEGVQTPRNVA